MQQILRTERLGDGVNVVWEKAGKEMTSYFSFTQLIDMRVNALDILNTPGNYGIDEKTGKVCFVAFCQPSRHQE
ncbi:MAG: hypothetical protein LUO97_07440 [Methanomicrobiales archaeon]|nr:hypothetical protein [Methanomicrobiales archaeon]